MAGPLCGLYLADMGADVVKVEHPTGGDASRTVYGRHLRDESAVFVTVNRNKWSVALDLAREEGRTLFLRLAERADVVIEAYRGGVAERLGIDDARLRSAESPARLLLTVGLRAARALARQAGTRHAHPGRWAG